MSTIWQARFWKDATTVAVKRMAGVAASVLGIAGGDAAFDLGILDVNWVGLLSVAGLAGVGSLLWSISNSEGPDGE